MSKLITGINGFGRFGQHLLKYWAENSNEANFVISYINDTKLTLRQAFTIITSDKYLGAFYKERLTLEKSGFAITLPNGKKHIIDYTTQPDSRIDWLGQPDIFFECSGKNTDASDCRMFLKGNTRLVLISATSLNADLLLVYGYNQKDFDGKQKIVSYGSCTINAFVPLANLINRMYGVLSSSADVIHNVPEYLLAGQDTLTRKQCTLEAVAPMLLDFIHTNNFAINYTLIPYTGVSIMDFRFELKKVPSFPNLIQELQSSFANGTIKKLYKLDSRDNGPENYKFAPYSAVLIEPNMKIVGNNLYIHSYFDNENSVNRFFDTAIYIISHLRDDQ